MDINDIRNYIQKYYIDQIKNVRDDIIIENINFISCKSYWLRNLQILTVKKGRYTEKYPLNSAIMYFDQILRDNYSQKNMCVIISNILLIQYMVIMI